MKDDVVAKRYAKALYDLGKEDGLQGKFLGDLDAIVSILEQSDEFRAIMESPMMTPGTNPAMRSLATDSPARAP